MWWLGAEGCHGGSTSGAAGEGMPGVAAEILDVVVAGIVPGIAGEMLYVASEGPDTLGNTLGVADRGGDTILPGAAGEASREIASGLVVVPLCDDC